VLIANHGGNPFRAAKRADRNRFGPTEQDKPGQTEGFNWEWQSITSATTRWVNVTSTTLKISLHSPGEAHALCQAFGERVAFSTGASN
jgi:hypothetical protein